MTLRSFFLSFFILCSLYSIAQYPLVGTKIRLGFQTTGDGLVYRGDGPPNYSVVGANNAYMYIDKLTGRFYLWDTVTTTFKPLPFVNGTAGYLPIFNDSNTLGNSVVSYNSTDNILNIGDNSSTIKLYLNGEELNSSPSANLSAFPDFFFTQLNSGIIGSGYPNQVAYFTTSNFIESSPNFTYLDNKLGLNTMTPDSTLTVIGGGRFTDDITLSKNLGFIKIGEYQEINETYSNRLVNASLYFNYSSLPLLPSSDTIYFSIYSPTPARNYFMGNSGFGVLPSSDVAVRISFDSIVWFPPPAAPGSKAGSTYALDVTNNENGALNSYGIRSRVEGFAGNFNNTAGLFSATNGSPSGMFSRSTIGIDAISSGNAYSFGGRFSANSGAIRNSAIEISSSTGTDSISYAVYSESSAKTYLNGKLGLGTTSPDSMLTVIGGGRFTKQLTINRLGVNSYGSEILSINNNASDSTIGENIWIGNGGSLLPSSQSNFLGSSNIGIGFNSLYNINSGYSNVSIGINSMFSNTSGNSNTALGQGSLYLNTTGYSNTAIGLTALNNNTTGYFNVALGVNAGANTTSLNENSTSNRSIYIGADAKSSADGNTNEIVIGYQGIGNGSNTTTIGNSNTTTTIIPAGKLGVGTTSPDSTLTVTGGGRFTNNITVGGSKVIIASDTSTMLSPYLKKQDTTSLSNRINLKLNISDTSVFARDWQITGTANYIPEFTGTNSIGNSIIYENSGKIGINTLTADSTLTVNGGFRTVNDANINGIRVGRGSGNIASNTAVGASALNSNTTGLANVAVGRLALRDNTTGNNNIAIGPEVSRISTTGNNNIGIGYAALYSTTTGYQNVAIGTAALFTSDSSTNNIAIGAYSMYDTKGTGVSNTAVGVTSLRYNTSGTNNSVFGISSGFSNTTGIQNTFIGSGSGFSNTTGSYNTHLGYDAGFSNSTSNSNTSVGWGAGRSNTGNANVFVGYVAGYSSTTGVLNSALGSEAMRLNTTGAQNTAIGGQSLYSNTTSSNNTAVGAVALYTNTGANNTAVGSESMRLSTTGTNNTSIGRLALYNNTTGSHNTAIGFEAGRSNTASSDNTFIGKTAGYLTTGNLNTFTGTQSGYYTTSGQYNSFYGANSGLDHTTGVYNVAVGYESGRALTTASRSTFLGSFTGGTPSTDLTGNDNTGIGYQALYANTTGTDNVAIGAYSLDATTTGGINTAAGNYSLTSNTTGSYNTAMGYGALAAMTTGSTNTGVGYNAGFYITSGGNNQTSGSSIYIGNDSRASANGNTNEIVIGSVSRGQGTNSIMLGNSSIVNLYCYDTSISSPSDERDKKNVETLEIGLDFILGLRPVAFDWNMRDGGKKDIPDVGFIAQEVEPLQNILPQGDNLNVVHYQAQDDRYFMQSANLIPVLVKAIQEQQKQIELLKAEINQLKK